MATIMNDAAYIGFPLSIKRGNPAPVDTTAVWYNKTELETYAASGATAYVGQILTLVADNKCEAYMISNEAGTLIKLASTTASGDLASDVATLQGQVADLISKVGKAAQGEVSSTGLYALIDEVKALAEGKVSSVGAADQSIAIGGTATSPTIGIKLDNTAGNAATLSSKGLMVTPGVVISTTQPTSDSHPVWINPEGSTDQYLELRGIFTPVVKTTMDEVAQAGVMYCLGEQTAVTVPLPDNADVGQMISVVWYNGATPANLSITGTTLAFEYIPSANTRSEINALWDGLYWAVICNEIEVLN